MFLRYSLCHRNHTRRTKQLAGSKDSKQRSENFCLEKINIPLIESRLVNKHVSKCLGHEITKERRKRFNDYSCKHAGCPTITSYYTGSFLDLGNKENVFAMNMYPGHLS